MSYIFRLTLFFCVLTLMSLPAQAYIGPGAAVAAVGYIFGPIIAVVVTVLLLLLWPMRILYKKYKGKEKKDAADTVAADEEV